MDFRVAQRLQSMNHSKTPLEIKSYYGGIYLYFKQQKLKAKEGNQNQRNKGD
jgi:hypothetical protein